MRLSFKQIGTYALTAGVITGISGCGDDSPLGNLAEECGLTCASQGLLEGNASISGLRSVDAFFGAVVSFSSVANELSADIDGITGKIAASVDLEPGASGADIAAAIDAKIAANVEGELMVNIVEPKCSASADVAIEATAKCDASVDPGSAEVMCMGSCEVSASASASCEADAEVVCKGTAPALKCAGTCKGECKFEASASCEGACMGSCDAECSVTVSGGACEGSCEGTCEGTCSGGTDTDGKCVGTCDGMCEGNCKLPAGAATCGGSCAGTCTGECKADVGGTCSGSCEGECEYTPPMAMCSGSAAVSCKATAMAGAMCSGKCEGEIKPPSASAECEASASAEADLRVSCEPPSVEIKFAFNAALQADVQAQAEFNAWINGFKANIGALATLDARGKAVLKAGANLGVAAEGAVKGALDEIAASGDLKASIGGACAVTALADVPEVITSATEKLQASASVAASISGTI